MIHISIQSLSVIRFNRILYYWEHIAVAVNQLFLGLGRRRVRAETARRMFDHLDSGDNGRDSLVDGSSLARDVGGSKIPRIRTIHIVLCEFIQDRTSKELTCGRTHALVHGFLGEFPLRKYPRNPVLVDEEGYPHFVRTRLLLFLLQSRLSHSLASSAWRHQRANLDNFLRFQSHESRPLVLREALPDFGLDNLLNRGDIAVQRTANGLGESFFRFTRYLPRRKS